MMPQNGYREVETLTRSAENVLRKLIRFLVGRISLVKLQEMVRFIYVEEAEDKLKLESPTKNVPLTKLALITGLDTRTLNRTRNHESYRRPFHKKSSFLREFTPAAAILDTWSTDPEFSDDETIRPKKLNLEGDSDSFARLFAKTIKSRGVTQQSILNRLLESGAVSINQKKQTVELVKPTYLPVHSDDQLGAFEMGYAAAANLMETIVHNFETEDGEEKLFQRGVWAHRIPLQKRQELRRAVSEFLCGVEDQGREVLRQFEENVESPTQFTAGISLFYFEDDLDRHKT